MPARRALALALAASSIAVADTGSCDTADPGCATSSPPPAPLHATPGVLSHILQESWRCWLGNTPAGNGSQLQILVVGMDTGAIAVHTTVPTPRWAPRIQSLTRHRDRLIGVVSDARTRRPHGATLELDLTTGDVRSGPRLDPLPLHRVGTRWVQPDDWIHLVVFDSDYELVTDDPTYRTRVAASRIGSAGSLLPSANPSGDYVRFRTMPWGYVDRTVLLEHFDSAIDALQERDGLLFVLDHGGRWSTVLGRGTRRLATFDAVSGANLANLLLPAALPVPELADLDLEGMYCEPGPGLGASVP